MHTKDSAARLLQETLVAMGLPPAAAYEGEDAWRIAMATGHALDVEYDDEAARLMITGDIGEIAAASRLTMYETLLQYNFIWSQTGGVRIALDGSTHRAVVMFEVALPNLAVPRLSMVLANLARVQEAWIEILSQAGTTGASHSTPLPLPEEGAFRFMA